MSFDIYFTIEILIYNYELILQLSVTSYSYTRIKASRLNKEFPHLSRTPSNITFLTLRTYCPFYT